MNQFVWFWIAVAIVLGIIESLTFSLTSIWGAISAVFCAVAVYFSLPFEASLCLFVVITVFLLLCTRPFLKRFIVKKNTPTNADRIIGSEGVVIKNITADNPGEVKVLGQIWSAVSEDANDIPKGTRVLVSSIDGVKVKVNIV